MKKLLFFLIVLFLFAPNVFALNTGSKYYTFTSSNVGMSYGNTIQSVGLTSNALGGYTYWRISTDSASGIVPVTAHYISTSNTLSGYDYVYFRGFTTGIQITSASFNADTTNTCEFIGDTTNMSNTNNNSNLFNVFAFKCPYSGKASNWNIYLFGNGVSNIGGGAIYLGGDLTYVKDSDSDSVSGAIQTQTNQLQLSLFGIQQSTTNVQQSIEKLEEIMKNENSDLNKGFGNLSEQQQHTTDAIDKQTEQDKQNTQDIIDNQDKNHKETMDTITDNSTDNPSGKFDSFNSKVAENGVITQLITMPVTLYKSILNSVNGSCTPYDFGSFFGHDLTMSCVQPQKIFGSTIWGVIDILFSGFFIFTMGKKMIKVFNKMSSMEEGDVLDD